MKKLLAPLSVFACSLVFAAQADVAHAENIGSITVAGATDVMTGLSPVVLYGQVGDTFTVANNITGAQPTVVDVGTGPGDTGVVSVGSQACNPVQEQGICNVAPFSSNTFTVTQLGSISVKQGSTVFSFQVIAPTPTTLAPLYLASLDPNGGSCAIGGDVKTTTFTVSGFPVKFPNSDACQRVGYRLVGWQSSSSTAMPGDLVTSSGTTFVAQWEGWVADGVQAGGGIFGGLGSSVSMSDDGTVVAGGGFFANTRVHRRSAASSGWSDAIVHDRVAGVMSSVDVSGDGSTLASTWGLWIGLASVGDGVVRSSIPSDGSRLRLEPLAPTLGVTANPFPTRSVSMSRDGSVQAIGERSGGSTGAGLAKVRASSGSLAEFLGENRGDGFGASVAVSADGSTAVVGAPLNDGAGIDAGSVRVFRRFGDGWFQFGSDIDGEAAGDQFGSSVAASADGSSIVVGAPFNDGAGVNSGQVRVFDWKDNRWVQRGADIDGPAIGGRTGHSVAMSSDGNSVVFGSPYASMPDWSRQRQLGTRCRYPTNGSIWDELSKGLIDIFLACDGLEGGRVDVMRWSSRTWTMVGQPIPGDSRRRVGFSVDMSSDGTKIVVGAPGLSSLFDLLHGGEMKEYRLTS